jgi:hypothetical protein
MNVLKRALSRWLNCYRCMTLDDLCHAVFRERATGQRDGPAAREMRRRTQAAASRNDAP